MASAATGEAILETGFGCRSLSAITLGLAGRALGASAKTSVGSSGSPRAAVTIGAVVGAFGLPRAATMVSASLSLAGSWQILAPSTPRHSAQSSPVTAEMP